ncbi:MAG: BspA family leucine-rich repeat surface protein, partial [Bacilli bacterium]|nr:BspA family leucine-rich repeat surface protein [Bacilli bacterium]
MNMKVKDYNIYKKENICVFLILLFSLFISIGYSAISTNLKISGDVAFMKTADIRVIGSSLNGVTNSGAQTTPVSFDYASISGGISLPNLNSTVTITVKTKNYVALDKEITSITNTTFSNSNIEYTISGYSLGDKILGNATTTFTITFKYKSSVTTVPSTKTLNYKLTFNFNNYALNMMIGNTKSTVSSSGYNWLDGPINSLNIEKIEFTTTNVVPSNAIGSWDVSTKQNGGIMAWYFDSDSDSKYEIVIGSSEGAVLASNLKHYAYYLKNLENFDAANLNISKLNSLSNMFYDAGYNVSDFIISNITSWDTSNVNDMSQMFSNAGYGAATVSLNLSGLDTSYVTNMKGMFSGTGYNATTLSIGDLSGWNTSNVTNMYGMFDNAGRSATTWTIGDLSEWNVSNVTNMSFMFSNAGRNATTWTIGDLSEWNVSNVTNISYMFNNAGYKVTTWSIGDLSGWNTSNVTNMSKMFSNAGYNATTWTIGDLSEWNVSNVTDMSSMFSDAGQSATTWSIGNLSGWNTSNVTNMCNMFISAGYNATTWTIGDLSLW